MNILILNVSLKVLPGAEKMLPEPAMGNMKPGSDAYTAKWNEKRAKQLMEAADHPLYGQPTDVQYAVVSMGIDLLLGEQGHLSVPEFIKKPFKDIALITGTHPTTHARAILVECLRAKLKFDPWFVSAPKLNPWHLVCPPSQGTYEDVIKVLGDGIGPVTDTLELLKKLGPDALKTALE